MEFLDAVSIPVAARPYFRTLENLSLEELYLRYSSQAYAMAVKILRDPQAAEDAVQEAFLKVWQKSETFDPSKASFGTWLMQVVHNLSIDQLRKKRISAISLDQTEKNEVLPYLVDSREGPEEEVWLKQKRETIKEKLLLLNSRQRSLIEMAFFGGFTHHQIAVSTGLALGTVKSSIRQGLLKLNSNQDLYNLI